ncbi:MAG: periplasmic nitrate reductase, NapE protein [Rhodocyclaceae bacterium]
MEQSAARQTTRRDEWRAFLLLTGVVAPIVTVGIVSGYGFLVWIYQMFAGPPGS